MSGLTEFQEEVARAFFSLDAAREFVLSGGAALIAHDMISRSTGDLDLFSTASRQLGDVVAAFTIHAAAQGWPVNIVRQSPTFARLELGDMERDGLMVDLGVESEPVLQLAQSSIGPTFQPIELAARKLLALFGRAEARDFCDVYELSDLYDLDELCDLAERIDPGFSRPGVAEALGSIGRFADSDFPSSAVRPHQIREFASRWRAELD